MKAKHYQEANAVHLNNDCVKGVVARVAVG